MRVQSTSSELYNLVNKMQMETIFFFDLVLYIKIKDWLVCNGNTNTKKPQKINFCAGRH